MNKGIQKYAAMQHDWYHNDASRWSVDVRDPVVGAFDMHNNWEDYNVYLFKVITVDPNFAALDFGCGPGRNLVKFNDLFSRFDGVDIAQKNLDNAGAWLQYNGRDTSKTTLYLCNGYDLSNIPSNTYDVVMSTICLQHICVYDVRKSYFKEFHRVLKPGGRLTAQMGFGLCYKACVDYYDNFVDATVTNGLMDVKVDSTQQLETDLTSVGFADCKFYIRPTGPGDLHQNWVFFNCKKI